jgi:hypothetical protein
MTERPADRVSRGRDAGQPRSQPSLEAWGNRDRDEGQAKSIGGLDEQPAGRVEPGGRRGGPGTSAGDELVDGTVEALGDRTWSLHHAPANTAEPDTLHGRGWSLVIEDRGELAQRPVLQDPDRSLAAPQHHADLAGRQPVDEAKHDDLATVVGQRGEGTAQLACLVGGRHRHGRIGRPGDRLLDGLERGRAPPSARAERICNLVVGDPEEP